MLKRQDLAKQFEDVVKQEIMNYNNSLNTIYQKINFLEKDIDDLKQQTLENDALIMSKLKELEVNFEIYRGCIRDQNQKFSSMIGDLESGIERIQDDVNSSISNIQEITEKNDDNRRNIHFLTKKHDSRIEEYECFCENITQKLELEKHVLYRKLEKFKEEFLSKAFLEAIDIKNQFENKLNSHVVDVEGVNKKIQSITHSVMVTEKKIENIYMLIDRIKKGENINESS